MKPLTLIVLERAEEQMATFRANEPTKHDQWAIRPKQIQGRWFVRGPRRRRCLAGDCERPVRDGSYCPLHGARVRAGLPVDLDLYSVGEWYRTHASGRPRFGGSLYLGRSRTRKPTWAAEGNEGAD